MKRRDFITLSSSAAAVWPRVARTAPVLRVGAALPDPPFEFMTKDGPAGFDITLMRRIAEILGREWQLVPYEGSDFNGIFAGLDDGKYDCIACGTTVTPERRNVADFCAPYAVSGQSLVVDVSRYPDVHRISDLKGLVIGVQQGNTSQPVADKLVAEHRAARVRVYAYDEIEKALDDLMNGGCDAFMKLAPATAWFVREAQGRRDRHLRRAPRHLHAQGKRRAAQRDWQGAGSTFSRWHSGGPDKTVAWGRGGYACVNVKTTSSGYFERAVTTAGPTQPPHPGSTLALA